MDNLCLLLVAASYPRVFLVGGWAGQITDSCTATGIAFLPDNRSNWTIIRISIHSAIHQDMVPYPLECSLVLILR